MTVAEAHRFLLSTNLTFGEEEQIEAHKLIELAEELKGIDIACESCDRDGEHECSCGHEHYCAACDGTGRHGGDLEDMNMSGVLSLRERAVREGELAA